MTTRTLLFKMPAIASRDRAKIIVANKFSLMAINRSYHLCIWLLLCAPSLNAQLFTERAAEMGIEHHTYEPSAMGGGVAIFDFDNDGHEDLYLTGGDAPDQLYQNQGDGTFVDVTRSMRITAFSIVTTMGVTAGDFDNDGFTDLFVTTTGTDRNYLLRNVEGEHFQDVSLPAGIRHEAWSTSAAMADYDGDGDLDIYVGNYVAFSAEPFEENITDPEVDFLYRNNGDGTFSLQPSPLLETEAGCTLATSFSDYDRDGRPDLFVLNDFGDFYQPNKLLRQTLGTDAFTEVGEVANFNAAINSMGISAGDINGDGLLDYYVTNINENPLHISGPDGTFTDRSAELGVNYGFGVSWGTVFTDVDNDGYLDLFFANGDLSESTANTFNNLFLGNGPGLPFTEASAELSNPEENKARGVAMGDLDNDGFPDLVVSNVRVSAAHGVSSKVYHNRSSTNNNWLSFSLEGVSSNRSALGAMVEVYHDGRSQMRELSGGGSYLSSNSLQLSFGLGEETAVDSVVVHWPQPGVREVLGPLYANQHYVLRQGERARIRGTAIAWLCPGGTRFVAGADRTEAGVYRQVIAGPELDTVLITNLKLRQADPVACPPVPDAITDISLFPNPARNAFTIQLPGGTMAGRMPLRIYASDGRLAWERTIDISPADLRVPVDGLQGLASGVYVLTIEIGGDAYRQRMVIVD